MGHRKCQVYLQEQLQGYGFLCHEIKVYSAHFPFKQSSCEVQRATQVKAALSAENKHNVGRLNCSRLLRVQSGAGADVCDMFISVQYNLNQTQ